MSNKKFALIIGIPVAVVVIVTGCAMFYVGCFVVTEIIDELYDPPFEQWEIGDTGWYGIDGYTIKVADDFALSYCPGTEWDDKDNLIKLKPDNDDLNYGDNYYSGKVLNVYTDNEKIVMYTMNDGYVVVDTDKKPQDIKHFKSRKALEKAVDLSQFEKVF